MAVDGRNGRARVLGSADIRLVSRRRRRSCFDELPRYTGDPSARDLICGYQIPASTPRFPARSDQCGQRGRVHGPIFSSELLPGDKYPACGLAAIGGDRLCVGHLLRLLMSFGVNAIDCALPGSRKIERGFMYNLAVGWCRRVARVMPMLAASERHHLGSGELNQSSLP